MQLITRLGRGVLPLAVLSSFAACDSSPVEELPPPSAVVVTASTHTLVAGSTLQLSASVTEADGTASKRKVAWESSDHAVATVNAAGLVAGVGEGLATITASVGGTSSTYELAVMRAPNPSGPQSTFLAYASTPGDWVGQGQTVSYNLSSGSWSGTAAPNRNMVRVMFDGGGATWWTAEFAAPQGQTLKVGTYENATRWPFQAPTSPGLSFSGSGRGCNTLKGRFVIHDIAIDYEGTLQRLHATFRQYCEGGATYLDGEVVLLQNPLR